MELSKTLDIFSKLAQFKNVEPIFIGEDFAIIKNKSNNGSYKVAFSETENGIVIDTTNAEIVSPRDLSKQEMFEEKVNEFKTSIKKIFSESKQEGINELRELIVSTKYDEELDNTVSNTKETKDPLKSYGENIISKFGKQLGSYFEAEKEMLDSITIFDEDGDIKSGKFYSVDYLKSMINSAKEQLNAFEEHCNKSVEIFEKFNAVFENEMATNEFIPKVTKGIKKSELTKAVVAVKTKYVENLNIHDTVSKLYSIIETDADLGFQMNPFNAIPATLDAPRFLKLGFDAFSPNDLKILIEELQMAMSQYVNMTADQLKLVSGLKQKAEYMFNTRQICDHTIKNIIDNFNGEFGKSAQLNI